MISPSDFKPDYIAREAEPCPHCGHWMRVRTNRYLYRCANFKECGRYW